MPTEFVYFDLGNVVVHFSHRRAAEQMAQVLGTDTEQVWNYVFESDVQQRLETGKLGETEFCQQLAQWVGHPVDQPQVINAASDIFWLNTPMIPLVGHLADAGVPLGILSNTCQSHWRHVLNRFAIVEQLFPITILSFEVGAMKPGSEIYRAAIHAADVPANKIFFIDDRQENVDGALHAGMDAHLFRSVIQTQRLLRERGLRLNY